eukprot:scaffold100167_cov65-Phaeocystis_antarctica.AAC.8
MQVTVTEKGSLGHTGRGSSRAFGRKRYDHTLRAGFRCHNRSAKPYCCLPSQSHTAARAERAATAMPHARGSKVWHGTSARTATCYCSSRCRCSSGCICSSSSSSMTLLPPPVAPSPKRPPRCAVRAPPISRARSLPSRGDRGQAGGRARRRRAALRTVCRQRIHERV